MDFLYSTVTSVLTRVRTSLLPDVLSSKPMTTPEETATSPLSASEQQEVPQKKDAFHEALWQTLQEKQYRGTIHASHPVHTLSPCPKVNPGFQVATAPAISNKTPIPVFDLPLLDSESGSGVSESDAEDYEHEEMESIQVLPKAILDPDIRLSNGSSASIKRIMSAPPKYGGMSPISFPVNA